MGMVVLESKIISWAKVQDKGTITIPKEVREKLGIESGDIVVFVEENGRIYLQKGKVEVKI